jgi:hypothetical protein
LVADLDGAARGGVLGENLRARVAGVGDDGAEDLDREAQMEIVFYFDLLKLFKLERDLGSERFAADGCLKLGTFSFGYPHDERGPTWSVFHGLVCDSGEVDKVAFGTDVEHVCAGTKVIHYSAQCPGGNRPAMYRKLGIKLGVHRRICGEDDFLRHSTTLHSCQPRADIARMQ